MMKKNTIAIAIAAGLFSIPMIARSNDCGTASTCGISPAVATVALALDDSCSSTKSDTKTVSADASSESCSACSTDKTANSPTTQPSKMVAFGEPMKLDESKTIDAAKVMAEPAKFDGQTVRLAGTVASVCASKGCWIKMESDGAVMPIFVKFNCPIDGRLIPTEAAGKNVIVEGKLTIKEITQDEARHYAEDEGLSAEQIEKIVGPQKQISIEGPSALVAM